MPSGAKKRKAAAKKKKQQEISSNNNHNNPQGNGDVKTQDEKDSDGGELRSPASQNHQNHQHLFNEGNEELEKKADPSIYTFDASVEGVTADVDGNEQLGTTDEAVIEIEGSKHQEDFESKNITIEHIESAKELSNGHGSSSSSSSSDDESQVAEMKTFSSVVEAAPVEDSVKEPKYKIFNMVEESAPFAYLVKPVDSLSKEVSWVTEDAPVNEVYLSALENAPDTNSVKPVVSESKSAPVENTLVSNVVDSGLKENGEKLVSKLDEVTGAPLATMDSGSKKVDYKTLASCNVVESVSEEKAAEPLMLTGSTASNGVKPIKDSEFPECSENQPLVASAPRAVQTTSWKSCCGLFEALTSSDR